MEGPIHRAVSTLWFLGVKSASPLFAVLVGGMAVPGTISAQALSHPDANADGMMLFTSAGASRVLEKVRSASQGVTVEVFVKAGDPVIKGQLLGHTELEATRLQLDLARNTMDSTANVDAARSQAEAWSVTRAETEEAVRKRDINESRLDWAIAMERMYQANHEAQIHAETTQKIQYEYWERQYENRFFRAPVEGIVSEVLTEPGKPVNFGSHVFTIRNDSTFTLPVTVPAELAAAAVPNKTLPVRSADGRSVGRALIDSVIDDPRAAGGKIIKLLLKAADVPVANRAKLMGMKFDVLLPQLAQDSFR